MPAEYDYESYLYPAGSAPSEGGGASSGTSASTKPLKVGTVTTLEAGAQATVTLRETAASTVLDFGIPAGAKGDKGNDGATGAQGAAGAKGADGAAGTVTPDIIMQALGADPLVRMQAILPNFEVGYIERPTDLSNNQWYAVSFKTPFANFGIAKAQVYVQPLIGDYRQFVVRNVTATGFEFRTNYTPDFQGLFYVKFSTE